MNVETQLKLQSYLDGELPETERRHVEALLEKDSEARKLFAELSNTDRALAGFESEIKLPESREFYWSKIEREINRGQTTRAVEQAPPVFRLWRLLVPAGSAAALLLVLAVILPGVLRHGGTIADSDDAGVFTYHNYEAGATLVWLDYPEENEFADIEADDTMDL